MLDDFVRAGVGSPAVAQYGDGVDLRILYFEVLIPNSLYVVADKHGRVMVGAHGHVPHVPSHVIYAMRDNLAFCERLEVMVERLGLSYAENLPGSLEVPEEFLLLGVYAEEGNAELLALLPYFCYVNELGIPLRDLTHRKVLFYDYIKHQLSTFGKMEAEKLSSLFHAMALDGKWKEMLTYVVSKLDRSSSTRDLIGGERALQAYIKGVLDTGDYYQPKTEMEVAHHPNDHLLFPWSDEWYKVAKFVSHTYIIEIKWLHSDSTEAAVKSKYAQAKRQLAPYRHDPVLGRLVGTAELHCLVLIVKGFDLVILDEIPSEVLDGMAEQ